MAVNEATEGYWALDRSASGGRRFAAAVQARCGVSRSRGLCGDAWMEWARRALELLPVRSPPVFPLSDWTRFVVRRNVLRWRRTALGRPRFAGSRPVL